jgi:hypothetical protein
VRAEEEVVVNLAPLIASLNAEALAADRLRAGRAARRALASRARRAGDGQPESVAIRLARSADRSGLAQLAALDSRRAPAAPVLVAEVDGVLRAAVAVETGEAVADPFHRTTALLELLELRAAQLREQLARAPAPAPEVDRTARVAAEGGINRP